ncbi:MAG: methyltransferase domain-containing protein [Gemmatimonadetes bacterium]|nr:methyltransferase domain-containing protein [Gemmatimonadota bacterium]
MWDVVEHLRHPDRYIERAAELLRTGGILCLTTGDIGSLNARLRRGKWRLIYPPSHLHYFSTVTMKRLLDGKGFAIERIFHPGLHRSVDQILYGVFAFGRGEPPRIVEWIRRHLPEGRSVYLNLYDIMCVTARKTGSITHR